MTDAAAFRFAARHPEYVVLLDRGSSQGDFWWHVRADGSRSCVGPAAGRPSRGGHAEVVRFVARHAPGATHVVYLGAGSDGRHLRAAV